VVDEIRANDGRGVTGTPVGFRTNKKGYRTKAKAIDYGTGQAGGAFATSQ
jgi:hypothetical protein